MDLNQPNINSIAARKAARKSSPTIFQSNESVLDELNTSKAESISQVQTEVLSDVFTQNKNLVGTALNLSKEEILNLAKLHGLKFESQKKIYIKHTYAVTEEAKATFKQYCDHLGFSLQDAMSEALEDFFKKYKVEYLKVKEAKKR